MKDITPHPHPLSLTGRGEKIPPILCFIAVTLGIQCGTALAASTPMAPISGTVADGTNHHAVSGAAVALYAQRNGTIQTVAQGRADARGRFTLHAPPLAGDGYVVTTTYKGVSYAAPVDTAHPAKPLTLTVYDTTSSDTVLIAPLAQIGMTRTSHGLQVAEEWTVVNPTQFTDVGSDAAGHAAAVFPIPSGATGLKILPGSGPFAAPATVERGAVLMDTAIRPATGPNAASFHQVKFAFTLPTGAGHPTLPISTRYLIGSLEVFALHSTLVAPGFTRATLTVGTGHVDGWRQQSIAPNTTLAVGVDGAPAAVASSPAAPILPPAFPYASVAILIGGGFILLIVMGLTRRGAPVAAGGGMVGERYATDGERRLRRDRERLVETIAELDLQHARGRVAQGQYERRRAREKGRLLAVERRLGG